MSRRMGRSARRVLMGVRRRIRYRRRNRSRGKWLRMLRKTLPSLLACGRVRSWMRGRMRMCNISRFRNNTHPLPPSHNATHSPPSSSLLFLSLPISHLPRRSKGFTRTTTTGGTYTHGAITGSMFFCLFSACFFHDTTFLCSRRCGNTIRCNRMFSRKF